MDPSGWKMAADQHLTAALPHSVTPRAGAAVHDDAVATATSSWPPPTSYAIRSW